MPTPEEIAAGTAKPEDKSLLDGGDAGEAAAGQKTPDEIAAEKATADAAKVAAETENKRILETEDAKLSAEDLAKKPALVKATEEKRLLETPKEKLSAEDQVKQAALLKAQEDAKKQQGAPEKYEDFKLPDGVQVNQPMLEEFKTLAKEDNLSQEKAQRYIDLQLKHIDGVVKDMNDVFVKIKNDWREDTRKELGANLKGELALGGKAIEKSNIPGLREMLTETGVGNRKELVKFFAWAGKFVSEDSIVDGKNKSGDTSDGQKFYGDTMK